MKLLNLGCGNRYHKDWTNVDFVSKDQHVIAHNLLKGIPFENNSFDAIYNSHVLEHFTKQDGINFIRECFRVLKPGGIIRIAVPDLEMIVKYYLSNLEKAKKGDEEAAHNYDWMMLELFDQTVRNQSGGYMAQYLYQKELPNEEFIYNRLGEEVRQIRTNYLNNLAKTPATQSHYKKSISRFFRASTYISRLKNIFAVKKNEVEEKYKSIGRFRSGGEIHQWMYDSYSLTKVLCENSFIHPEQKTAFESKIPDWNKFQLESKDGVVFKPDSLFIEAIKPS